MTGNPIETFKIMEFLIILDIFSIFLLELEIYCHGSKSTNQLDFLQIE